MEQIKRGGRGFSFKIKSEPLDMRISMTLKKTAADIINSSSAQELYEVFARNSEEINSWSIAQIIYSSRRVKKIETIGDLIKILNFKESTLRRIFQALRIEVNNEFDNLKKGLAGATNIIGNQGRILVVTFHSLEDRIVKKFVRENNLRFLTKKPIVAKKPEQFERSAKLRAISI
jgi:16S rRNA (cytosine1402-N4)-methyltransferase